MRVTEHIDIWALRWMTSNTCRFGTYSPHGSLSFLSSYQSSFLQITEFAWELICRLKIEDCTFHDKLVHSRLPGELELTETNSGFLYWKEALQLPTRETHLSELRWSSMTEESFWETEINVSLFFLCSLCAASGSSSKSMMLSNGLRT